MHMHVRTVNQVISWLLTECRQQAHLPHIAFEFNRYATHYDEVYSSLRQYGQYSDIQTSKQTDRQIQIQ